MSRRAGLILAASLGVVAVAFVIAGVSAIRTAEERSRNLEAQLLGRIAQSDSRIDQLNATLDARLKKTESAVAGQEAKKAAKEAERADLAATPKKYLRCGALSILQSSGGLFSSASARIITAAVENRSHFSVTSLRGTWECRSENGALVASMPATIEGTLLAGQTATLRVSAGDVQGYCGEKQSKILVESAAILGADSVGAEAIEKVAQDSLNDPAFKKSMEDFQRRMQENMKENR